MRSMTCCCRRFGVGVDVGRVGGVDGVNVSEVGDVGVVGVGGCGVGDVVVVCCR